MRRRLRESYRTHIAVMKRLLLGLQAKTPIAPNDAPDPLAARVLATVRAYEEFVSRSPFVYTNPPPPPEPDLVDMLLARMGL
jgi:hypothetical protein